VSTNHEVLALDTKLDELIFTISLALRPSTGGARSSWMR